MYLPNTVKLSAEVVLLQSYKCLLVVDMTKRTTQGDSNCEWFNGDYT